MCHPSPGFPGRSELGRCCYWPCYSRSRCCRRQYDDVGGVYVNALSVSENLHQMLLIVDQLGVWCGVSALEGGTKG